MLVKWMINFIKERAELPCKTIKLQQKLTDDEGSNNKEGVVKSPRISCPQFKTRLFEDL
jgi:hypothetical protein